MNVSRILRIATAGYLVLVGFVTLCPQPVDPPEVGPIWFVLHFLGRHTLTSWITFDRAELFGNVTMFVPIGLLLTLLLGRRRWWLVLLIGALMTCGIEFAQRYIAGRVSDLRDLVSNSIGTVVGVVTAAVVFRLHDRLLRSRAAVQRSPVDGLPAAHR